MSTRERILTTAFQLFSTQGVKRITMDDIANELGMSKRTIYEHFSDKEEILVSSLEYLVESDKQAMTEILLKSSNILEAFVLGIINIIENYRLIRNIFYLDIKKYYPKAFDLIIKQNDMIKLWIQDFISQGQKALFIRQELDPVLISTMIAEHLDFGMFYSDTFSKDPLNRKIMFETAIIIFIRGLATFDGLNIIDNIYQDYKSKKNIS